MSPALRRAATALLWLALLAAGPQLVAAVSHDLHTPLTTIQAFGHEMLRDGDDGDHELLASIPESEATAAR